MVLKKIKKIIQKNRIIFIKSYIINKQKVIDRS